MAAGKIVFDAVGKHFYETGVDQTVLYPYDTTNGYKPGVAWDGVSAINENPDGAEPNDIYADNIKYLSILSAENYGLTIEAYQSPEEFDQCDGAASVAAGVTVRGQARKMFGLCWRTKIGNDVNDDLGYKYHLAWGLKASPSDQNHETVNDSPEASSLSWEAKSTPINVTGYKPIAKMEIDSTTVDQTKLTSFLAKIYGTDGSTSYSAASPEGTENPYSEGWYERSGTSPDYTYTLTSDTTVDSEKTYYIKTVTGGTEAFLPMPADVISHFGISG